MIRNPDDVTEAVLAVMGRTPDPRLREIMVSLVEHLHGFVRDVALTEDEFRTATTVLNQIGQASTDSHNEAVLMAGSLGVSSLVCLLNNGASGTTETTQNLLGPFWRADQPASADGASIVRSDTPGDPLFVIFELVDPDGVPVAAAEVDVWHSSPTGLYENQDPGQADHNLRGRFVSDADGRVRFRTVRPAGYPIPTDGVVGRLLGAQGRHPFRPAHVHALAYKPGFKTLITQIYDEHDPHLETDPQFGVTAAVLGRFVHHTEAHPGHSELTDWYSLHHRLVMERGRASMPTPPIR
ncbi:MAG: catechol 1,2-dioxygenase [Acidimicrobiia bacterium]|nr:catechol 1,2-dioxygenase [Acidimicrobiia bacterium]